jgi:hypothetical protein
MAGQSQPPRNQRPKGKSPQERSEEFSAAQRQLKQEAADRREAAAKASKDGKGNKSG